MSLRDLSHPIESGMTVYPGSRPVRVERTATVAEDGACVTELDVDTHVGTHVDAPAHTLADGDTLGAFDPAAFVFDARLVDCTGFGSREPIPPTALPDPADADLLALHTGWDDHWGTERYRDHPYLSPAAAEWCGERGYSVALDTFGPDPTPSADPDRESPSEPDGLPAHDTLFEAGSLLVENLTGLDAVPTAFRLQAVPLAVDAEAAPVRAIATER